MPSTMITSSKKQNLNTTIVKAVILYRLIFLSLLSSGLLSFKAPLVVDNITISDTTQLRLSTFDIDVTPTTGSWLAYDKMINRWDLGLRAKGIILTGSGKPIVLCAIDWEEISNGGMDEFKTAISKAAGTTQDRVSVHVLHQHDAPLYDPDAEKILIKAGVDISSTGYNGTFARTIISKLSACVKESLHKTFVVTHIGLGTAEVKQVASNRHIFGTDGRVRANRFSAASDGALRNEPEGLIDPLLSSVSFWNNDTALAVLTFYATHPQSYYRTGIPNPDFPGIARFFRQLAVPDALHIHFNGAGGNIAAGKYNDGSHENRLILAERMSAGMKQAWESTLKYPVTAIDVEWNTEKVSVPPANYLYKLKKDFLVNNAVVIKDNSLAQKIAWLTRIESGKKLDVACLKIKNARLLYLPGELFIEYQLAAKAARPDLFIAMAAYGNMGMEYIGTAKSYSQGGYEVSEGHTGVGPEAENILMNAIKNVLNK